MGECNRVTPFGEIVAIDQRGLFLGDRLVRWTAGLAGYGGSIERPRAGQADVLTPPSSLAVLRHGYIPELHPTVRSRPGR